MAGRFWREGPIGSLLKLAGWSDARNEWPVVIAAPKRPTFVIFKPSVAVGIGAAGRMDRKGDGVERWISGMISDT